MKKRIFSKGLFVILLFINQLSFAATITWNGSVNTDWGNVANWTGGLPTSADDVTIPIGLTRYPIVAANASIKSIFLVNTLASLTVNSGVVLNITTTLSCRGSIQNFGTINVNEGSRFELSGIFTNKTTGVFNSIIPVVNGAYGIRLYNLSRIINEAGGVINATGAKAIFMQGDNTALTMLSNSGTMNLTGGIEKYTDNLINETCGIIKLITYSNFYRGEIINQAGLVQNNGYFDIQYNLTNNAGATNFVNDGLIKIGNTAGTFTNNKLRVRNNPANATFMTIGTNNNLVVDGIYTDLATTVSAGTYSLATNVFTPAMLPSGSQTLYAKITYGACSFVAPITYVPLPVFTSQYTDRNLCTGASEVLNLTATDAISYQWQSSSFANMSTPTNLSTSAGSTTILGNASFANKYIRCTALNNTGSVFSDVFRVFVSPSVTAPTAVSTSKNNLCSGVSASLSATCTVGSVKWYDQATGGTALATGSPFMITPSATTTYYAACENTACFSNRVSQAITVVNAVATQTLVSPTNDITAYAGILLAGNNIKASNKIETTGKATFQTGKYVELDAGFEAKKGAVFQAMIQAVCNN
ncbi:3-coathanger stack domain-containing protein [Emticicia sp. W12TSBA100-4]|uniref:immunoglobulin domain-containing protein n=1 Tax=Emticicia sp. W12TSBA100-4 TaxID=3160965 RepID=UPI0033063B0C